MNQTPEDRRPLAQSRRQGAADTPLDVIILGAGTAGLAAAREVRKRTERFVLINDGPWGTTCARVGCMPSKLLIEAANAFHRRHSFDAFGIRGADALKVDLPAVLHRVRALRDQFVDATVRSTDGFGEHCIAGRGRLVAPDRVEVDGRRYQARRIVLATGSRPVVPAAWQSFGDRILTTDTLFEQHTLAPRIGIVGLGPIGIELAQALARLGLSVVGFGSSRTLAGITDEAVDAMLREALQQEFALHTGSSAELSEGRQGIEIRNGKVHAVVDQVIAALGRRPDLAGLGLEALGIPLDARGMPPVDPATMRIGDLPVFLAGDANGRAALLHEAADEGHIAGINAAGPDLRCFRRRTPLAIVFCEPNVAIIGKRWSQLDASRTRTGEASFARQGRARVAQRNHGLLRVYADAASARLLGAELVAPAGEHLAHLIALAIERELTVHELLRTPFYHPVLEEGLRTALRTLAAQFPATGDSDLAACEGFRSEALD
jgi:dihydrolipoamide dehydrogenase